MSSAGYKLPLSDGSAKPQNRYVHLVGGAKPYLWTGSDDECWGWYSGGARLRWLALRILAAYGKPKEKELARKALMGPRPRRTVQGER